MFTIFCLLFHLIWLACSWMMPFILLIVALEDVSSIYTAFFVMQAEVNYLILWYTLQKCAPIVRNVFGAHPLLNALPTNCAVRLTREIMSLSDTFIHLAIQQHFFLYSKHKRYFSGLTRNHETGRIYHETKIIWLNFFPCWDK